MRSGATALLLLVLASLCAGILLASASLTASADPPDPPACTGPQTSATSGLVAAAHPVVLVHGWTGQPLSDTRRELEKRLPSGWQFLLYDYQAYNKQWASQDAISGCLAKYLEQVSAAHRDAGGNGVVYTVGHSMGGLALRFAATEFAATQVDGAIGGIVTVNTPHTGSPFGNSAWVLPKDLAAFFPAEQTPASRCLAPHVAGVGLPDTCVAAPYVPATVPVSQVGTVVHIRRDFFGLWSYDLSLVGDSVVPMTSQFGYVGSAAGDGDRLGTADVVQLDCTTTDRSLFEAAADYGPWAVIDALSRTFTLLDSGAADAALIEGVNKDFALTTAMVNLTTGCSHSKVTTWGPALDAIAAELISMATHNEKLDPATWSIGPGSMGPYQVGMRARQALQIGLVERSEESMCDSRWEDVYEQGDWPGGIWTEWRRDNPDDLDIVSVGLAGHSPVQTSEGIGIGSTIEDLKRTYGSRLTYDVFQPEGDPYGGHVLFGPHGALVFGTTLEYTEGMFEGDPVEPPPGAVVEHMHATKGSSMEDLAYFVGGC